MMKFILPLFLWLPLSANASFLFKYGLNYSSQKDSSSIEDHESARTFHKISLGASINGKKTLFLGWGVNSWNSTLKQGTAEESAYSLLEMGPNFLWFLTENYNFYITGEWNPYARGDRDKNGTSRDIQGSSMGFGMGYRYRLSRFWGLGASINYHSLGIKEEKIGSTEDDISDKVTNLMPMLELTLLI